MSYRIISMAIQIHCKVRSDLTILILRKSKKMMIFTCKALQSMKAR